MPKASVIVVNYNGKQITVECLKALEKQTFKDFQVIVVDNGSTDGSLKEFQNFINKSQLSPYIKLVPLNKNLGFAGGNIEGLKYAIGDYIALLNNDTEADENWLMELTNAMDYLPDVGICASKIIAYGKNIIDTAGDGFSTSLKGFKRGEGEKTVLYDRREYVFGACAGAALYRRRMIEEIGFLDKDFFLIHEDTDLNFRAHLYGWKVLYVPTAIVHHKVRSSIGNMSGIAVYYTLRNSEFVRIKNVPCGVFLRCLPEFIIGIVTEFIYFAIRHGLLGLYFKAKMDALKMLPKMLKKRGLIMRNRKVSNNYLYSIMTLVWQKDFLKARINKLFYG